MDSSMSQNSQTNRTIESFCAMFCSQIEMHKTLDQPDEQTVQNFKQKVGKIFSQLKDERRWTNFANFVKRHSSGDGGELFCRFALNWFVAIQELDDQCDSLLPMIVLILQILPMETVNRNCTLQLNAAINDNMKFLNGEELKVIFDKIYQQFLVGETLSERFLSVAAVIIRGFVALDKATISEQDNVLNGPKYIHQSLLKLLNDVVVNDSFKKITNLSRECLLHDVIIEFIESEMGEELTPTLSLKLIHSLPEMPPQLSEKLCIHLLQHTDGPPEELYPVLYELRELFDSKTTIPKLFFTQLSRNRLLVCTRKFALYSLLALCSTARYCALALAELCVSIARIQKHSCTLRACNWTRNVIGDDRCDVRALEHNLQALIQCVLVEHKWFIVLGDSLVKLAFTLMHDKGKLELRISGGRVVGDTGVLAIGKSMLVSLAGADDSGIGKLLSRIFTTLITCNNRNTSIVLIDTIVEIVLEYTIEVLNSWETLRDLVDKICSLNEEIAISLTRALLPIIVLRPQLIKIIVNRLKKHILNDMTVATALSILLMLLRSSTMRSAVNNDFYSQSFATFSTQALRKMGVDTKNTNVEVSLEIIGILKRSMSQPANVKSILYRGLVEACYANENLVDGALEMIASHFTILPQVECNTFVSCSNNVVFLIEPLPDLVKALSSLLRLAIYKLRNTSTQVVNTCDALVNEGLASLAKLVEYCIDRDVHDLQIDKITDFSMTNAGRSNLTFSYLMNSLYDSLVEHLWHTGNVLVSKVSAEKITGILRRQEELNEVLKEKITKKKDDKVQHISVVNCVMKPQIQTISQMAKHFIMKSDNEDDTEIDDECIQLLRESSLNWTMNWAEKISKDINDCTSHAPFKPLCEFVKTMIHFYVADRNVAVGAAVEIWDHKATQAVVAISNVMSLMISKYGSRTHQLLAEICSLLECARNDAVDDIEEGAPLLLAYMLSFLLTRLLESYQDFHERKISADHNRQVSALVALSRALLSLIEIDDEKSQSVISKNVRKIIENYEISSDHVRKEIWNLMITIERRGKYSQSYMDFLRTIAVQIIAMLDDGDRVIQNSILSINIMNVNSVAELLITACSQCFSDVKTTVEIMAQVVVPSIDASLVEVLTLCDRLAEIIEKLLPVHIVHCACKEPISTSLTSLYTSVNSVVKLMLSKHKNNDLSEWKSVAMLATLARGTVLRIMEKADENVGTLNPSDEPSINQSRKFAKSQKDETIYVAYVRARELYQANLLLLSSALKDARLHVQVRNNSIGVRDFRIDAERLRQRMEEIGDSESDESQADAGDAAPTRPKRVRTE